jgi:hypothetical protein
LSSPVLISQGCVHADIPGLRLTVEYNYPPGQLVDLRIKCPHLSHFALSLLLHRFVQSAVMLCTFVHTQFCVLDVASKGSCSFTEVTTHRSVGTRTHCANLPCAPVIGRPRGHLSVAGMNHRQFTVFKRTAYCVSQYNLRITFQGRACL